MLDEMNTATLQNWNMKIETWTNGCKMRFRFGMLHCATKDHKCDLYMRCHLWSSARPPTKASWMCGASENSVQSLLQLLHGKCPQSVGGWIWFEHARLLGEGVDALLCWSSGLLLQLQIQHACKYEVSFMKLGETPHRSFMDVRNIWKFSSKPPSTSSWQVPSQS